MPTRSSKPKDHDFAAVARRVVEQAIGDVLKPAEGKNVHAQALSALGASKGGKARAESLTAKQRQMIAKHAAKARWGKTGGKG